MALIDEYRSDLGGEPICEQVPVAPSVYYEHEGRERDPAGRPGRHSRALQNLEEVRRACEGRRQRYGARKVWRDHPR